MARQEIELGPLFNSRGQAKVPVGRAWSCENVDVELGELGGGPRPLLWWSRTGAQAGDVAWGMGYGKQSSSEVQKLVVTGGVPGAADRVKLQWDNGVSTQVTGDIGRTVDGKYLCTAEDMQNAFELLSTVNVGDVRVSGGPWPGQPLAIRFQGQYANRDVSLIAINTDFPGAPTVAISQFIKGGTAEVLLVAIQKQGDSKVTLYAVDVATKVETVVATGLHASDWTFRQMGDRIFALNSVDGIHWFRLGGFWDDAPGGARPSRPQFIGGTAFQSTPFHLDFGAGSLNAAITATNVTETVVKHTGGGFSLINAGAGITTTLEIVVTCDFAASQDWQFSDFFKSYLTCPSSAVELVPGSVTIQLVNAGGTSILPKAEQLHGSGNNQGQVILDSQFAGSARIDRDDVDKLVVTFKVTKWAAAGEIAFDFFRGMVWMCNALPVSADAATGMTQERIEYAYSYYNATTDVESLLSDARITPFPIPQNEFGCWVTVVSLTGNPLLTVNDRIYVYRRQKNSGLWRRLPVDANNLTTFGAANVVSGSTSFQDRWMEDELEDFPLPAVPDFPGQSQIAGGLVGGDWKRCLVLGADKKAWESFVRQPDFYAPDPDDDFLKGQFAVQQQGNADVGRTLYVSDNKSEEVLAIVGQDSLYAATPMATYAAVGDTPGDSSEFRRMPGSRGALGIRGACRFGGGVQVCSSDGLWYYSVGRGFSGEDNGALAEREETLECRRSYRQTLGPGASTVVIEHEAQTWVFSGSRYLWRNREAGWTQGSFEISVKEAHSVRGVALRVLDSLGRIYAITSGIQDGSSWSYESGLLDGPRVRIEELTLMCLGRPRVEVRVYEEGGRFSDEEGRRFDSFVLDSDVDGRSSRLPVTISAGQRHKILLSGACGVDRVEKLFVGFEGAGSAYER